MYKKQSHQWPSVTQSNRRECPILQMIGGFIQLTSVWSCNPPSAGYIAVFLPGGVIGGFVQLLSYAY